MDTDWIRFTQPPHPARIAMELLERQCDLTMTRRGGPGGQHRNKTSTAVILVHRQTQVSGEAAERRSQLQNRRTALQRLRMNLAIALRTNPNFAVDSEDHCVRQQYGKATLRISFDNADCPAVFSLVLDDLVAKRGELSEVAGHWQTSHSQILRLLKTFPPALMYFNRVRESYGLRPLR